MKKTTILIASDHAGFLLKKESITYLQDQGFEVNDYGCFNEDSVDYPDYAKELCKNISVNQVGILICGSGIGMSISANRFSHVRAALCMTPELAKLAREHNDANILVLGARFIDKKTAFESIDIFLSTKFIGGKHQIRVNKI